MTAGDPVIAGWISLEKELALIFGVRATRVEGSGVLVCVVCLPLSL